MDDLDHILNTELDEIEAELEKPTAGGITEEELTDALIVCKNSVEKVFGPITILKEGEQETVRHTAFQVFLSVLQLTCPRQPTFTIVENSDSGDSPY